MVVKIVDGVQTIENSLQITPKLKVDAPNQFLTVRHPPQPILILVKYTKL